MGFWNRFQVVEVATAIGVKISDSAGFSLLGLDLRLMGFSVNGLNVSTVTSASSMENGCNGILLFVYEF